MPDLADIQSLVVRPAPQPRTFVLLFGFGDAEPARAFLRWCLPQVPSAAGDPGAVAEPLHLSLTWAGLARLCRGDLDPDDGARQLEPFFVDQTPDHPAVAPTLGFVGTSAPERWWDGRFGNTRIHLAVHASFADDAGAEAGVARIRAAAAGFGLSELRVPSFDGGVMNGARPAGGILHFGYRDGITAPDIDWADDGSARVDCREILLGYPNKDYPTPPIAPGPWRELVRDGSIACVAWIHQDVAAFNRLLEEEGGRLAGAAGGDPREWLAARIMGRWRDGSPTVRWPDAPPPAPDLDDGFGYAGDPGGERCPLNAHIRVVHARDDRLTSPVRSRFPKGPPRFMRRGFTYGPGLDGTVDDGRQRGIVGTFLCARVNEQFYTVLRWMQATTFANGFHTEPYNTAMQDALIGQRGLPGADPRLPLGGARPAATMRDVVTFRGVACLLMPSLAALHRLSD